MNNHDHPKNWRKELAKVPQPIREAILNRKLKRIGSQCAILIRPNLDRIIVIADGQPVVIELSETVGKRARIRVIADPGVAIMRDQIFRKVNSEIESGVDE